MQYADVFNGSTIYPSEINYSAVDLTADIYLSWPEETSASVDFATRIMDVTPDAAGRIIFLPSALQTGTGNTILFNNRGAFTFTVKDVGGTQVVTIAAGTLWQVYLTSNTTADGGWNILQYGATTSTANASALAGTGIIAVGTLLSQSMPISSFNTSYTAGASDRSKMFNWTSTGGVFTLPTPSDVGNNWFVYLRNSGTGVIAATPTGITTIDGASVLSFQPGESAIIGCDGANFYTIGFGQSAIYAFNYTVIAVPGTGDYALSGTELNNTAYRFTGILTGNKRIIVPATVQQYWVDNRTTGAFTLTIAPFGGGLDIAVAQGARAILYCDSTDVVGADTAGVSYPVAVNQGGTGATTASAARINLGGGATGIGVFTSVTQAAAWSALGVAQAGVVDGGAF